MVRYMEEVVIPYEQSKGMTVTASFIDDEDPDGYVWIRRFNDEDTPRRCLRRHTRRHPMDPPDLPQPSASLLLIERTVVTRAIPTISVTLL
jgi:hypothetical protein